MACLTSVLEICCSFFYCRSDPEAEPLLPTPDREFPPPDTILTPPRPRMRLPGTTHSSTSSMGHLIRTGQTHGPGSPRAQRSIEQLERISQVHSNRMMRVRTSQPTTPSTARFESTRRTTSSANTPITRLIQPLSSPEDEISARTHPLPTPIPFDISPPNADAPNAPPMARSVSEPQGLSDLGGFAAHQLARGRSGSISVIRGFRGGRPRSATVNLQHPTGFGEGRRGRSPGFRPTALRASNPNFLASSSIDRNGGGGVGGVGVGAGMEGTTSSVPGHEDQNGSMVRRDLGIGDMFRSGRGRGRGRPHRGRSTTH